MAKQERHADASTRVEQLFHEGVIVRTRISEASVPRGEERLLVLRGRGSLFSEQRELSAERLECAELDSAPKDRPHVLGELDLRVFPQISHLPLISRPDGM